MGGCNSRTDENNIRTTRPSFAPSSTIQENGQIIVDSANRYDEEALVVFKKQFSENPELFILNNLIMSVMFFECYDTEIGKPKNPSKIEKLNSVLIKEQSKQCIMPDTIFETVNKHVRFRPIHGPKKYESEPLVAQRLFVVYDNIEVLDLTDSAHYSGIDKPSYRVHLEECKRKGFVKLKQLEYIKPKMWQENDYNESGNNTSRSSVSSDEKQTITNIVDKNSPSTSKNLNPPNSCDSSDSYDYSVITQIKTPQPLCITLGNERSNSLPNNCFKPFRVKNIKKSDLDEYEDKNDQMPTDLFKIISYISSAGFMDHFKNSVFPNSLGRTLGFDENDLKKATSVPGMVFCSLHNSEGNKIKHEIIPAARIQWPSNLTFEWKMRDDRPTIIDTRTTKRYKWPTDAMINHIVKLPCVVIPRGYIAKRGVNEDSTIEWEVGFPKVERYIESRMSHAQMRSFLIILTLYKTFIEPKTNKLGLLPEHIRILMYWECEKNFLHWSENRLGCKLLSVLRNLYTHLGRGHLPDYFIRNKNVFENIPGKYLRPAQKALHAILESPLTHFIVALRNLRYTSGNFYPSPNYKKLLEILQNDGWQTVNPAAYKIMQEDKKKFENTRQKAATSESEWYKRYGQYNHSRKTHVKLKQRAEEETKSIQDTRKSSVSSIDLEYKVNNNMDVCKKIAILRFFINFFVEIAKKSLKLSTTNQSLLYSKQAWYLTKLLEEIDGCKEETREFFEKIKSQEDMAKIKAASEPTVPSTPKRNLTQFFVSDHVQMKEINLANLNNSFNSTALPEKTTSQVKHSTSLKTVRADVHEKKIVDRHSHPINDQNSINNGERNNRRRTIQFNPEVESTEV